MQPLFQNLQNNAERFNNNLLQNHPADRIGVPRHMWFALIAAGWTFSCDMAKDTFPVFLANLMSCGAEGYDIGCVANVLLQQDPWTTGTLVVGALSCMQLTTQLIDEAHRHLSVNQPGDWRGLLILLRTSEIW